MRDAVTGPVTFGKRAKYTRIAIVDFDGKVVFRLISRYHGGAFAVFSKTVNENMTALAVDGSFASVIDGTPAPAAML